MSLSTPAFIRIDLFPATITTPNPPKLGAVRVIVTDAHVYVFGDSSEGPVPVFTGVVTEFSGDNKTGYVVELEDGGTIGFKRSSGCGCGSKLRGFRPFPGVPLEARMRRPNL